MSREFGIRPQDMAHLKPWHLEAMRLHIEELNRG
jgi:hypothetical protein